MIEDLAERRIEKDLSAINDMSLDDVGGVTRLSLSPEHAAAVRYCTATCKSLGMNCYLDEIGNFIARKEGSEPDLPAFAFGSHLDSVKNGGRFDGAAGVAIGLEVIRKIRETGRILRHPLQLMAFSEEEGVLFQSALAGSRYFSGALSQETLFSWRTASGKPFESLAREFQTVLRSLMDGELPKTAGKLAWFIEPHVEQGPLLEETRATIGIVSSITGTSLTELRFTGEANHAGTTPAEKRKDPVRGFLHFGALLEASVQRTQGLVATIGRIVVRPNVGNVIPADLTFTVDLRCTEAGTLEKMQSLLEKWSLEVARECLLDVSVHPGHKVPPAEMDARLREGLTAVAATLDLNPQAIISKAGHDALSLSSVCPVGMIFLPSKGGRSHSPEEESDFTHLAAAARVLSDFIIKEDGK